MAHPTRSRTRRQIQALRTRFAQRDGLPFADVLPAQRIEQATRDHGGGWREDVFNPVLTWVDHFVGRGGARGQRSSSSNSMLASSLPLGSQSFAVCLPVSFPA